MIRIPFAVDITPGGLGWEAGREALSYTSI